MTPEAAANYLFNGSVNASLSDISESAIEGGLTDAQLEEILAEGDRKIAERVNGAELRESKDALENVGQRLAAAEQASRDKDDRIADLSIRVEEALGKAKGDRRTIRRIIRSQAEREVKYISTVIVFACVAGIVGMLVACFMMNMVDVMISVVISFLLALFGIIINYFGLRDELADRIEKKRVESYFPEWFDEE